MDELNRFLEENQEPLSEIITEMGLPTELTAREVGFFKMWREQYHDEWSLIKEIFLRGVLNGKWQEFGFVYVDVTLCQLLDDGVHSLDDLRVFEERERERLKRRAENQRKPVKMVDSNRPPHDPHYSRSGLVELLPCPFCGSADVVVKNQFSSKHNSYYTLVECVRCKASTRPSENFTNNDPASEAFWKSDSVLEVARLWNMRV